MPFDDTWLQRWLPLLALAVLAAFTTWLATRLLRPALLRLAGFSPLLQALARRALPPLSALTPLLALQLLWQAAPDTLRAVDTVRHLNGLLLIAAFTWLAASAVRGVADGVIALHPADVADNLHARQVQTQTRVLARIAYGAVLITGLAFILMTFPRARQLGTSLLASAGVAGLVVGIAARSVFGNLLAGLQIALAQPIRIDDVLIVEGEWGRVEEISATYVVLKIWDERRLVVPLQWFIEHPFQNWTRREAQMLGTVMLWVDFTLPVAALRAQAEALCRAQPTWDGRVCVVQVTETSDRGMQVRVLVSAGNSGDCFDLRCALREGLIDWLRHEHPGALPRLRLERDAAPTPAAGPPQAPGRDIPAPDSPSPERPAARVA